ncbi:rhodanese-like domain-containing protein [Clostridium cylindrosporum]|uniref:Rhodanese-like sulfurtransferase n=1 Tax=Clostridium cylindrosporum DSM 605 TaxID=1121307 RepID=A0A0J8FZF7_CLOCY|nr:rhodanese-like domain-containing protein [Clostridium cylindrosporum]KMT20981.1 rhodanese-like sulfurtransferase [Clostridium cylindrosporum DSM 605]
MFGFFNKSNFDSINVNDLGNKLGKITIIDVREPSEYKRGHIPTATNIPMGTILENTEKHLDKAKEYHIVCQSGKRSERVCSDLTSKGYKVINVFGGTGSYVSSLER